MIEWIPVKHPSGRLRISPELPLPERRPDLGSELNQDSTSLRFKLQYSLNLAHSIDDKSDTGYKQLIYVPENQLNVSLGIDYGSFYATFLTDLTGKRYTETDNSKYLPAYMLSNLIAGFRLKPGVNSFNFCLKAENIFNVRYESIAYYPMPGRSFMFSVTYQFIKPI